MTSNDVTELLAALRTGSLEPGELALSLAARIDREDDAVLAFLPEPGRLERLEAEARELEARHPHPASRPALFGLPVAIKDIVHVDGFQTAAGSLLPPERFAGPEAPLVGRLRQAGALVLGKTTCTEFAVMEPPPTRNPRAPGRTPGGSSSGSAAAVAAGFVPASIGSQTTGSVLRPAAFCGVVGFKPSRGRAPCEGFVPISPALDHPGWFASNVAGVRALSSALMDGWREVEAGERPPRLGYPVGAWLERVEPAALAHFEATLTRLEERGCALVRLPLFDDFLELWQRHADLMSGEMARVHAPWFDELRSLYRPRTAAYIEQGRGISEERMEECRAGLGALADRLSAAAKDAELDLFVSPSALGPPPLGLASTGDTRMSMPWTHAGVPALSLPAGELAEGSLGLQLAGLAGRDEEFFESASWIEDALASDSRISAAPRADRGPACS